MKNTVLALAALFVLAVFVSGCAYAVSPVVGTIYTNVKAPAGVTELENSSKMGAADCTSILGAVAFGDCSIDAAAKAAGITKVHHVDYESTNVLFVYARFTTMVYGE